MVSIVTLVKINTLGQTFLLGNTGAGKISLPVRSARRDESETTARSVLNGLGYTHINGSDVRALTDRFNHPEAAALTSSTLGKFILLT